MAVRVPQIDYYSLHGMWGAYASLALGRIGRGAGVVVGDVRPPQDQCLYAGYRAGSAEPRLLPFAVDAPAPFGAASFKAEEEAEKPRRPRTPRSWFAEGEIERLVSLSGEEWRAGALSFRVVSFLGSVPDPATALPAAARARLRPSLLLVLGFDNSAGTQPMTGLFAMRGIGRLLSDATQGSLLGAARGRLWGFAARPEEGVEEVMDWDAVEAAFEGGADGPARPLRRLASEGGLRFRIGPGQRRSFVVAVGAFREGVVTAGLAAHAYHACLFKDLEEALEDALAASAADLARAEALDAELDRSGLGPDRSFLLAHAAHSYAASAELLAAEDGSPVFVVNEGEYRMMNTLDLTVDQVFWEARYSPWTIANVLDSFLDRWSYRDGSGLAFAHDQGVADSFSPAGGSAYELPGLTDVFSFMSYEETLNWVLAACLYASLTGDRAWLSRRSAAIADCVRSLTARDANGDGIMDRDSSRCEGGSEITTYDSLDISLGQARNNLYLAVKAWAAFVCAAAALERIGSGADASAAATAARVRGGGGPEASAAAAAARAAAAAAAATIASKALPDGYIPAVFEGDNRSKIIPAVEGLLYPAFCGAAEALERDGPYGELIRVLARHLDAVLVPGACLDPASGGWKLSSTSDNTWLSKIFLNQYVAETILGIGGERVRRDAVHAAWLRTGSADFAATDQVDSATGRDLGSRLYPRLVTAAIWTYPLPGKGAL